MILDEKGAFVLSEEGLKANSKFFCLSMKDFEIMNSLGSGHYGQVYMVNHIATGSIMAMKQIRLNPTKASIHMIYRELDVLINNRSPVIVDFYGAFINEGHVCIIMEFMDFGSLDHIIARKRTNDLPIEKDFIAAIAYVLLCGLKYLRETFKLLHRDIKPSNILLNTQGSCKLCDFGICGQLVHSLAKTYIGSATYMAPERLSPQASTYGITADIWSVGVTLYELATGKPPYPPCEYECVLAQLMAIVYEPPPILNPEFYGEDMSEFIFACLQSNPDRRITIQDCFDHRFLKDILTIENCRLIIKNFVNTHPHAK